MNLLNKANWIVPSEDYQEICPVFRKRIKPTQSIKSAKLYITALGLYEAKINGMRVGEYVFAPGWTSYHKRMQYQEYDVTDYFKQETAEICVTLGKGWCVGKMTWDKKPQCWEKQTALIAAVEMEYNDGSSEVVLSDTTWQSAKSSILMSEIYDGETYDARILPQDFKDCVLLEHSKDMLIPQEGEIVREIEEVSPIALIHTPKGETVIDFGQNLTGYVRFNVTAKSGDKVEISHAEILDKDGDFYTGNMRRAENKINYTCAGNTCAGGSETYHPHFSFQGFRYIRLDSYPGDIDLKNFRAIVVHSDMERTGYFECSNPLLNRLYENVIWGQKGNYLDVPTDCPQRDERLGWTGDAQVFIKAASYNFDVERFFIKWLRDLRADQLEDGGVPHVIPNMIEENSSAAWGDVAVICPWQLYLTYGNREFLAEQFDSMQKWVEYIRAQGDNEYLWNTGSHYGDWLGLDAKEGDYKGATDESLIATAFYAYSTSLLIKAGTVLNKDMSEYKKLYENIVKAYQNTFIKEGVLTCDTQTAHVLTLHFNLAQEQDRAGIAKRLSELVIKNGNHLTTGFVGTPYLLYALAENGYEKLAVTLLLQEDFPSWLYPITKGATTIWEHWDGIKPDGSLWSDNMNSYNHYAYGAVADFLYSALAGIRIDEKHPAFSHIQFTPLFDDRLSFVKASVKTRNGTIKASWIRSDNGTFRYTVTVPKGVSGCVNFLRVSKEVGEGTHTFTA